MHDCITLMPILEFHKPFTVCHVRRGFAQPPNETHKKPTHICMLDFNQNSNIETIPSIHFPF